MDYHLHRNLSVVVNQRKLMDLGMRMNIWKTMRRMYTLEDFKFRASIFTFKHAAI